MVKTVAIISNKKKIIEKNLGKHGLVINEKNPEAVIAFGGDGTLLFSEQIYPNTPKVFIKHPSGCSECEKHDFSYIFDCLRKNKFEIIKKTKIEARFDDKKLVGMNDINIHYKPPRALRFFVEINGKRTKEIIGDGLVVATPYGSSGYYKSITRKVFSKGLGLAFNNPVEKMKNLVVPENSIIKVKILRESCIITSDCDRDVMEIKPSDIITVKKHPEDAKIVVIKGLGKKISKY